MGWLPKGSVRFGRDVLLTIAGVLLAGGTIVLVGTVAGKTLARAATGSPQSQEGLGYIVGGALFLGGLVCGCFALLYMEDDSTVSSYNRYLVGTGYALTLLAAANFTALVGFQLSGQLVGILEVDFTTPAAGTTLQRGVFLTLVPGFAVLGALFFHANSLRKKRDSLDDTAAELVTAKSETVVAQVPAPQGTSGGPKPAGAPSESAPAGPTGTAPVASVAPAVVEATKTTMVKSDPPTEPISEPFSAAKFWAGLWFRVGEALLFALIAFLLAKTQHLTSWSGTMLLIVSLLLGMFVKSGETLVAGLADRVFGAVQALVKR